MYLKKHVLTAECCVAELFTNGTAHDTWQFTTILQMVFMWHSNFSDFWVAPCIFPSWECVQLPSSEVVMAFDLFIQRSRLEDRMKGIGETGFLLLIVLNVLMVCRFCSFNSKLSFNTCLSIQIYCSHYILQN